VVVEDIVPEILAAVPDLSAAVFPEIEHVPTPIPVFVRAEAPRPAILVRALADTVPVVAPVDLEVVNVDLIVLLPLVPLVHVVVVNVDPLVRPLRTWWTIRMVGPVIRDEVMAVVGAPLLATTALAGTARTEASVGFPLLATAALAGTARAKTTVGFPLLPSTSLAWTAGAKVTIGFPLLTTATLAGTGWSVLSARPPLLTTTTLAGAIRSKADEVVIAATSRPWRWCRTVAAGTDPTIARSGGSIATAEAGKTSTASARTLCRLAVGRLCALGGFVDGKTRAAATARGFGK
jgi:hypothetical protein